MGITNYGSVCCFLPEGVVILRNWRLERKLNARLLLDLIGFGAVKGRSIVDFLFAARLQSFVRSSQKDFRLSSAAQCHLVKRFSKLHQPLGRCLIILFCRALAPMGLFLGLKP